MSSAFQVKVARRALRDMRESAAYIRQRSPLAATKWLRELLGSIQNLKQLPYRHPSLAIEDEPTNSYRRFLHYSHQVIYRVDEGARIVYVVRVYHSARGPISWQELETEN